MISQAKRYRLFILSGVALFALAAVTGCKDEPAPVKPDPFVRLVLNQVLQSTILKGSVGYHVLLPEGYNESTETYPVVYLLHGYDDTQSAWITSGGLQYYADQYIADTGPMIYVMPQGFNTYYINKYNGNFPYMRMFVEELVPAIDKTYRTKKDKTQRAVMGYSMGGYGALILPAMNPDVFTIGVPLSMSFRTDEQYVAEPQGVFNSQWATNFGPGTGVAGTARLWPYFQTHSPFHFFDKDNISVFSGLKILIDCGDDEETLSKTNDALHVLMRSRNIPHEYRVRNGGHSFDYWKKSYPEALRFISNAVRGVVHPEEATPVEIGTLISLTDFEQMNVSGLVLNILKPTDYATTTGEYPVLYFVHDVGGGNRTDNVIKVFSLLRNGMTSGKMNKAIVVEVAASPTLDIGLMETIVAQIDAGYRTKKNRMARAVIGNGTGGTLAAAIAAEKPELIASCFLMQASLPDNAANIASNVFYYLDITDDGSSYKGYNSFYNKIRQSGIGYEYRVRPGGESYQAFLNGLGESLASLKQRLTN